MGQGCRGGAGSARPMAFRALTLEKKDGVRTMHVDTHTYIHLVQMLVHLLSVNTLVNAHCKRTVVCQEVCACGDGAPTGDGSASVTPMSFETPLSSHRPRLPIKDGPPAPCGTATPCACTCAHHIRYDAFCMILSHEAMISCVDNMPVCTCGANHQQPTTAAV